VVERVKGNGTWKKRMEQKVNCDNLSTDIPEALDWWGKIIKIVANGKGR